MNSPLTEPLDDLAGPWFNYAEKNYRNKTALAVWVVLTGPDLVDTCIFDRQAALPLQTGAALVKLISCG